MPKSKDVNIDPLDEICNLESIECGRDAAKHFAFAEGYTNLNHGSYGTYPIEVRNVLCHYQESVEARPDAFVRYEYRTTLLDKARDTLSEYLDVPVDTCVLVPNVTTAFDTILRNLVFAPGDVIVYFSTIYGSFANTVQYITETTPAEAEGVEYVHPVSDDFICEAFEARLQDLQAKSKTPKVAIFDTINSLPALRMPFERLTEICRSYNVLSCIDAGHGVGQLVIDIQKLDPDFFMSNCHKWLHVPRPCALLFVPKRNQHLLRTTLPTGFGFVPLAEATEGKTRNAFVSNFAYTGTLDDAPYLCIEAALKWRQKLRWGEKEGEEAILAYTYDLASKGGRVVADILGTEVLENDEGTLGNSMTNVSLPLPPASELEDERGDAMAPEQVSQLVMRRMILKHETAVVVTFYGGEQWVRLSAQVYLTLGDFERAGMLLKEVCNRMSQHKKR